jgi:Rrf2 family protein
MQLARHERGGASEPLGIPEIASGEGLGTAHVGKIMRQLRQAGLVRGYRGAHGGYRLVRAPERISLLDALAGLDGESILEKPCSDGSVDGCVHDAGCTLRVLWGSLDDLLVRLLAGVTLADLLGSEESLGRLLERQHPPAFMEASV